MREKKVGIRDFYPDLNVSCQGLEDTCFRLENRRQGLQIYVSVNLRVCKRLLYLEDHLTIHSVK